MKMIMMVGLSGSGKTSYSESLLIKDKTLVYVSQDLLGSRYDCIRAIKDALLRGLSVIVDRTNINKQQRQYFINVAKQYDIEVECIVLDVPFEECVKRVQDRKGHPTVKEDLSLDEKHKIVKFFFDSYEIPTIDEGFTTITFINNSSSKNT